MHENKKLAPLTGIAFASNWLISKLNLNSLSVKTPRMTTNSCGLHKSGLSSTLCICWTDPKTLDTSCPYNETCSKASGLTPLRWLWCRIQLKKTSM